MEIVREAAQNKEEPVDIHKLEQKVAREHQDRLSLECSQIPTDKILLKIWCIGEEIVKHKTRKANHPINIKIRIQTWLLFNEARNSGLKDWEIITARNKGERYQEDSIKLRSQTGKGASDVYNELFATPFVCNLANSTRTSKHRSD